MSKNPILKNITEYLVDEGSYEEEALLGKKLALMIGSVNYWKDFRCCSVFALLMSIIKLRFGYNFQPF